MNAIEIEEAVSNLVASPCILNEFPFSFLAAFGNKDVTIKKLRNQGKSSTNKSDVEGGVLQRLNIHIAVSDSENLDNTLTALRESPQTAKAKAKYVLATDGKQVVAEELSSGDVLSCEYRELGDNFGFFLSLAGISVVREVKDNPIDIKATSRLNKLYVELLKHNSDWTSAEKQVAFNQFLARLVFCFFAEDTGVFAAGDLFTDTVSKMTEADGSNTHEVLQELFKAMDRDPRNGGREPAVKSWADPFPYVNGGLFAGTTDCPKFTRTARSYLLRAGELNWQAINPDIFGSMIQAMADDEERSSLGMHYTSVPNIEKVLKPLFLDSLNEQLEAAGDNSRKLLNLRKRLSNIRVFDPACGSGNFLVIAYIRMREIEVELMKRRHETLNESSIQLTQFCGIEIKPFAVEIARLSLLIAEFQCNVRLIGQIQAKQLVLPLHETGNIVAGNALRMRWEEVCQSNQQAEIYICGNPPFAGLTKQSKSDKEDLKAVFTSTKISATSVDYVCAWHYIATMYCKTNFAAYAFVSTNSICQGSSIPNFWKHLLKTDVRIRFAYTSFVWKNLAKKNAGVIVVITGLDFSPSGKRYIYEGSMVRVCEHINAYLTAAKITHISNRSEPVSEVSPLVRGSIPNCDGNMILTPLERNELIMHYPESIKYIRRYIGSQEISKGIVRYCLFIPDDSVYDANKIKPINERIDLVAKHRRDSKKKTTREKLSKIPHKYELISSTGSSVSIAVARTTSETREYLAADIYPDGSLINDNGFYTENIEMHLLAILLSKMHVLWIATVCGRMKNDYRYANTLGWNTFPLPQLTENNRTELARCAENILLAREEHYPKTIGELYDPEKEMPSNLRYAHNANDETLERIYIGRKFSSDNERLEKMFQLYSEMTEESA